MQAEHLLRQGNIDAALAELKAATANDPANPKYRIFLFQIFAVLGKYDSALTQLELAGELDPGALGMVQIYRQAIECQQQRANVFGGDASPLIFGEPEPWMAYLIEAVKMDASSRHGDAQRLRLEAFDNAPATAGSVTLHGDSQSRFQWIADADPRLGPMLEAIFNGQYYWVPFHRIAQIDLEPPQDLRDLVWVPAHFVWSTGGETYGLIPTRYPGSENDADAQIRLARKTDWYTLGSVKHGDELQAGIGQRMLASDTAEYALLDVRKICLEVTEEANNETAVTTAGS